MAVTLQVVVDLVAERFAEDIQTFGYDVASVRCGWIWCAAASLDVLDRGLLAQSSIPSASNGQSLIAP
jgi:hypothetical protein